MKKAEDPKGGAWPQARRRDFLGIGAAGATLALSPGARAQAPERVWLVVDPADAIAAEAPAQWALARLRQALIAKGAEVREAARLSAANADEPCIAAMGPHVALARQVLEPSELAFGPGPEQLALIRTSSPGRLVLAACGSDARGLSYALNEITDRLDAGASIDEALFQLGPALEAPAVPVRSIMRQFVSKPYDRAWYEDRDFWPPYLDMLAQQRFNRFQLAFGLGYDSLVGVTDAYMLFLYPFLVDVPGHDVSVSNFTPEERAANLEALRFISEQATARGLDFELGIWTHGYQLIDSPNANHEVLGLTPATHAAYCRDALAEVLRQVPAISSVGIRFHGESGVPEGSYEFWRTVYEGARLSGRSVEIDLHAKGVDQRMIDAARASGMPVNVSEKCWAEHHGMTYHQADIRPGERPAEGQVGDGLMSLSEGSLSFTRYGYANLLREDRNYSVRHRVFAGTQKLLASADPSWASAYAKRFTFCGTQGFELMEPLTCRGRRGTAHESVRRSAYTDDALDVEPDWKKFLYWYRVWGRMSYDPECSLGVMRRHFGHDAETERLETALARASRILPIVTTAYMPSAACDAYWPEVYWNQPMAAAPAPNPYFDTPAPYTFQYATPHDPQLFSNGAECAAELLSGEVSGRYTPLEVAVWLDDLSASVAADLDAFGDATTIDQRRHIIDARILAGLGRFFAAKFRAGMCYAIHEQSSNSAALDAALAHYRDARAAWAELSARGAAIYASDLSVSDRLSERGDWAAHLPLIDADIAQLEAQRSSARRNPDRASTEALRTANAPPPARAQICTHAPPVAFTPGADLTLEIRPTQPIAAPRCLYRHVNQAERWREMEMSEEGGAFRATIPAAYTDSPYPLQYYFVAKGADGAAELHPGLGPHLTDEPYYVVRRA